MSFHILFCFVQNDIYYFVDYFVTYTNHLPSFCSVLTMLTTILKMKTKKKKRMKRMRVTKERPNPMMGNPLGHLFVRVQKFLIMWVVYITYT
jgi:hypothetical protein